MAGDRKRIPFHEEFAGKVIRMLEEGTAPWQKPWRPAENLAPRNPLSGTVYKGVNRLHLAMSGFEDPRWMTVKQANDAGYRIKAGSRSTAVVHYQFTKDQDRLDENGQPVLDGDGNPIRETVQLERPVVRMARVFNAEQVEGFPPLPEQEKAFAWSPQEKAEQILANSGAVIKHDQYDRAFYRPANDEIHLPPRNSFDAADKYYATALHELAHWTGHPERMNREFGPFGSAVYAREELRAEISSWMVGQDIGVGHDPDRHAAYVKSWVKALREDPLEIMRACRDAEKIREHVLGFDRGLETRAEPVRESEEEKRLEQIRAVRELMQKTTDPEELDDLQGILESYLKTPEQHRAEYEAFKNHPDTQAYAAQMAAERRDEKRLEAFRAHPDAKEFVAWLDVHLSENDAETPEQLQAAIKGYFAEHPGMQARLERLEAEIWGNGRDAAAAPPETRGETPEQQERRQSVPQEPAREKTWLAVPYQEKDIAKKSGARWDGKEKKWYAPEGADLAPLQKWLPIRERAGVPQAHLDPAQEFAGKLAELGLDLEGRLPELDGKLHRVPLLSKDGRGMDGTYCLYGDGIPAGWAQNHVTGEKMKLVATGVVLSPAERERQQRERAARLQAAEAERARAHDAAARRCRGMWDSFGPATPSPYLEKKGVEAFGLKEDQGNLIVPLRNINGELRGFQAIAPDGQKSFATGMEKKGNFHLIGAEGKDLSQGEIVLCEGYATGASLHMATGRPVAVAFDSGNLLPVAEAIRDKYPRAAITICADNDHALKRDGKPCNVGVEKAKLAAQKVNGKVRTPAFSDKEKALGLTDFNDLHKARGLETVRRQAGMERDRELGR